MKTKSSRRNLRKHTNTSLNVKTTKKRSSYCLLKSKDYEMFQIAMRIRMKAPRKNSFNMKISKNKDYLGLQKFLPSSTNSIT